MRAIVYQYVAYTENKEVVKGKVEAVDPYTVRITLKAAVPSLLGLVSNYHGGMIVSRKAELELEDLIVARRTKEQP